MLHKTLLYVKAAVEMLVKLTPGLNFINVLRTAFTLVDPKSIKKTLMTKLYFLHFWDLRVQKLCIECWWNWHQVEKRRSNFFEFDFLRASQDPSLWTYCRRHFRRFLCLTSHARPSSFSRFIFFCRSRHLIDKWMIKSDRKKETDRQ